MLTPLDVAEIPAVFVESNKSVELLPSGSCSNPSTASQSIQDPSSATAAEL